MCQWLQEAAVDLELLREKVEVVTANNTANGARNVGIGAHLLGRIGVILALAHVDVHRAAVIIVQPLVRADREGGDLGGLD